MLRRSLPSHILETIELKEKGRERDVIHRFYAGDNSPTGKSASVFTTVSS